MRAQIHGRRGTHRATGEPDPPRTEVPFTMRRVFSLLVLPVLVLLVTAQVALAAKPIHEKFLIDETFDENLCGIAVTTRLQVDVNALFFEDRVIDVSRVRLMWTNDAGDWLQNSIAGPVFNTETIDGDILTITTRHAGVHSRLRSADGLEAAFDRGQITFVATIDLNDLENHDDDVFLGFEIVSQHGPHPEADSDFELFCEVVNDVLG